MEIIKKYTDLVSEAIENIKWSDQKLYDPMKYMLNLGGKKIRPALTLLGAEMAGARAEDAISQAVAVELFHNFSLIHDDIMDRADLRRGNETVHKKWDEPTGILSGDGLMVMAYEHLINNAFESTGAFIRIFSKMALDVCEGQMKDMDFEYKTPTQDEYIDMIRQKTAVLLGSALQIGFLIGKDDEESASRLYQCGVNWGIAFQIKDDYLDIYGDERIGKTVGGDILSNKKTILYLTAYENADDKDREILEKLFANHDRSQGKIDTVKAIYDKYNVGEACLSMANRYYKKGNNLFGELVIPREARKTMLKLAEMLLLREY
ncbi:MAG: polyprenyl synthetase family protein [Cryomorphaceae bacterium]|nr:polyprenyl synthetase family protein [Cryomorphaceae bacterium]